MTAYAIVRSRIKAGRSQDLYDRLKGIYGGLQARKGLRKVTLTRLGGNLHCTILEWDSIDDLMKARGENRKLLDTIRDLLEDLGGGLGVTYPVSGEAVVEFARSATGAGSSNRPRAWSIVRYTVKAGNGEVIEAMNRAIAAGPEDQPKGLRKMAVVRVGERAFCLLSEWDSPQDLAAGNPAVVKRLEGFREVLEGVPGGRELAQSTSGDVVLEFARGDGPSAAAAQ